jgi:hypothetical protein
MRYDEDQMEGACVTMLPPSRVRVEILPLKSGGFFARLVSLVGARTVDGPSFPTEDAAAKWAEGRLGLRA